MCIGRRVGHARAYSWWTELKMTALAHLVLKKMFISPKERGFFQFLIFYIKCKLRKMYQFNY
jgi:hypothetical protein